MAVTSGAMSDRRSLIGRRQHLEGKVARRVDPQHLEGNLPQAAPGDLVGRAGKKIPASSTASSWLENSTHIGSGEADVPVAAGGEPVEVVRPDDGDAAARPAHPLHLGQAGLAAVSRGGREGRAGDDQVGEIVRQRAARRRTRGSPGPGRRDPPAASFRLRIWRNGIAGSTATTSPATLDELERQPSRARADLGDPVYVVRQPAQHIRMEPLGAGQPVIELRFEPVQQLPGQDHVGLRITVPLRDEPARLLAGEHAKVGGACSACAIPDPPGPEPQTWSPTSAQFLSVSQTRTDRSSPSGSSGWSRSQKASARFSAVGMRPLSHGTSVFRLR